MNRKISLSLCFPKKQTKNFKVMTEIKKIKRKKVVWWSPVFFEPTMFTLCHLLNRFNDPGCDLFVLRLNGTIPNPGPHCSLLSGHRAVNPMHWLWGQLFLVLYHHSWLPYFFKMQQEDTRHSLFHDFMLIICSNFHFTRYVLKEWRWTHSFLSLYNGIRIHLAYSTISYKM